MTAKSVLQCRGDLFDHRLRSLRRHVERAPHLIVDIGEALLHEPGEILLLGGLAGLAIVLTGIGLFAVVSYLVRERTKELGLRMAIGASPGSVMKLVVSQSLKLALFGTGLGLALTFVGVRLMTSMVYAIRPNDPLTFLIVAILVGAISIVASGDIMSPALVTSSYAAYIVWAKKAPIVYDPGTWGPDTAETLPGRGGWLPLSTSTFATP